MALNLEEFIRILESWGFTDILLPFLLIFAILFAILEKVKVFGDGKRNVNGTVAFVISLLTVIPHVTGTYPAGFDVVAILNKALPSVSLVIIAVIMLLLLVGIFGGDATMFGIAAPNWIGFISIIIIVYIFGGAAGWWGGYGSLTSNFSSDAIAIVIMLLVFGIIISFITGSGQEEDLSTLKRIGIDFPKVFGGGKK